MSNTLIYIMPRVRVAPRLEMATIRVSVSVPCGMMRIGLAPGLTPEWETESGEFATIPPRPSGK
jgi:hypothetical protein